MRPSIIRTLGWTTAITLLALQASCSSPTVDNTVDTTLPDVVEERAPIPPRPGAEETAINQAAMENMGLGEETGE